MFQEYYKYEHREANEYKINLYDLVVINLEESVYYSKLALKLLNISSIIYSLNMKSILHWALSFRNFRSKHSTLCRRFVFVVTLTGFSFQVLQIFYDIIHGSYVASGTYLESEDLLLPDMAFCVDLQENEKISRGKPLDKENHRMTGTHLNKLTSNFAIDTILEKLVYLNKRNEFVALEMNKTMEELRDQFNFRTTFYRNWKCLEISTKIVYNPNDVYCLDDAYLLKFYLNRTHLPEHFYFGFMEQGTFGRMVRIRSDARLNRKANFEIIKQKYTEKFSFLKHPLAWFYERLYGLTEIKDRSSYLKRLGSDFKRQYNLTTRLIPLGEEYFDYEIHDQLFFQFYS